MMQPKGKHERPQKTSSVNQLSKITSMVNTLPRPSGGGGCICGTYVVPPVTEGLMYDRLGCILITNGNFQCKSHCNGMHRPTQL